MKVFIVLPAILACVILTQSSSVENVEEFNNKNSRIMESVIREKIEEIRKQLKEQGIPELGISSLDPLIIDDKRVQLGEPVNLDLNVTAEANGLLGFDLTHLKVSLIGLKFDFTVIFPQITAKAEYGLLWKLIGLDVFGNGDIRANATNLSISGHGNIKSVAVDGKIHMIIDKLNVNVKLEEFDFEITGLMGNEFLNKLLSKIISASVPVVVEEIQDEINFILQIIIGFINDWITSKNN